MAAVTSAKWRYHRRLEAGSTDHRATFTGKGRENTALPVLVLRTERSAHASKGLKQHSAAKWRRKGTLTFPVARGALMG